MPELDNQSITHQNTDGEILSPEKILEDSLRKYGIVHPIVTKPDGEIICGRRRLETAQKIGLEQIPKHIMNPSTPLEEMDIRLIENLGYREYSCLELTEMLLQRKLLWEHQYGTIAQGRPPADLPGETKILQRLQHLATDDKPDFYEETGKLFNRGKRWVYQMLELNDLSEELKTKVRNGDITYMNAIKENKLMTPVKVVTPRLKKNIQQHWGITDAFCNPFYTQLQQWYQQTPELMKLLMALHKFLSDWNELTNIQNEFDNMDVELGMKLLDQYTEIQQRMNVLIPLLNQAQEENMERQLQSPPLTPAA